MSGWQRLWIVASILMGLPVGATVYSAASQASASVSYPAGMTSAQFWQNAHREPQLSKCDWTTAKAEFPVGDSWLVRCDTPGALAAALPWALVPGLILGGIGLTVRWIFRGFRPPPA